MTLERALLMAAATAGVALLVLLASVVARRHPNPALGGGVRMPVLVAVVGWLFAVVGAGMTLVVAAGGDDDALPAGITGVAILLAGVWFLVLHRTWRLAVLPDRLFVRTWTGRVRCIVYDEIVASRMEVRYGARRLSVRAADGTRFATNPLTFDVAPLMDAIARRGFVGHVGERWAPSQPPRTWA